MAEDKAQTKPAAPKPEAKEAPSQSGVQTFPVTALIKRSREYLGLPTHVAAGALYREQGEMSIASAQQKINDWLSSEVEQEA